MIARAVETRLMNRLVISESRIAFTRPAR